MLKTNKEIEEIFNRKFRGPFGNTLGDSNDSLFFLLSQRKEDIAEIVNKLKDGILGFDNEEEFVKIKTVKEIINKIYEETNN